MKNFIRFFLIVCLIMTVSAAQAQYILIQDSNFGEWLNRNSYSTCLTGNSSTGWYIDTTCNKIITATNITMGYGNIRDITGIQYFKNLSSLYCNNNYLSFLPKLPDSLIHLDCQINNLIVYRYSQDL
jgi:Leucine-rich repeat (LRR) protein